MQPAILHIQPKTLIGIRLTMSLANNRTPALWRQFIPLRHTITHPVNNNLFSVAVYGAAYFSDFSPTHTFDRWAAMEVSADTIVPNDMERFDLPGGRYAVFHYKGSAADSSIFQYIYGSWIPQSDYVLDDRPHFEVLGDKYDNHSPDSEEEIWIPIKPKQDQSGYGNRYNGLIEM